ncbi:hypothetical protein ABNF97_14655 [Plantactinospora sp. B6F1]|uniref:hypothetical protein n=1 Tax=Plantactinospora sp. B6F1 TaxID=3158971 RepID=UPI00102CD50D
MIRGPVLERKELRRLPFQRRPIAEPGTRLVFQMSSGQLVAPAHPYTTGDVWWRGPRAVYVIYTSPQPAYFTCTLPCAGDTLFFDAAVRFSFAVSDPVSVVREQVSDPIADCRRYLMDPLRAVTRKFTAMQPEAAERAIRSMLAEAPTDLANGLRITDLRVELTINAEQGQLAKDLEIQTLRQQLAMRTETDRIVLTKLNQDAELARHQERAAFHERLLSGGGAALAGSIVAQDPTKATEAAKFMMSLYDQDQKLAVEALKVIMDGDQIRLGEMDSAVQAVVERFKGMISQGGGQSMSNRIAGELSSAPERNDGAAPPASGDGEEP